MIRRRVPFVITLVDRIRPATQSLFDAEQHAALVKGAVAVDARLRPAVVGLNDRPTWRLPSV
jgi:mannitol-1-phosphate/altronate dehydrogenase